MDAWTVHRFVTFIILSCRNTIIEFLVPGYDDNGAYWRSWYEDPDFEADIGRLWNEVGPEGFLICNENE